MKLRLAIALALISIPVLTGCGGNGGSNNPSGPSGYGGGLTCSGNVCYPTGNGCINVSQPINFYGTGLQLDAMNDITGGVLPGAGSPIGTVVTNVSQPVGGATFVSQPGSISGNLQMNVQSANPGGYGATTASMSGQLQLSNIIVQDMYAQPSLQSLVGGYNPGYGYGYGSSGGLCVSGMAIQGHLYTTGQYGFGGQIFLYLNNSSHGYIVYFY